MSDPNPVIKRFVPLRNERQEPENKRESKNKNAPGPLKFVTNEDSENRSRKVNCLRCGALQSSTMRFCTQCGMPLQEVVQTQSSFPGSTYQAKNAPNSNRNFPLLWILFGFLGVVVLGMAVLAFAVLGKGSKPVEQSQASIEVMTEAPIRETEINMPPAAFPTQQNVKEALEEPTFLPIEPTAASLPNQPVAAGIPVIYDNWALTLSPNIEATNEYFYSDSGFTLSFSIRNMGESTRVFRYEKSGISVSDDLGNMYEFLLTSNDCQREPDKIHLTQQITIDAGKSQNIKGQRDPFSNPCFDDHSLPPFKGVIPIDANKLKVTINSWGPYNDVDFYIDL